MRNFSCRKFRMDIKHTFKLQSFTVQSTDDVRNKWEKSIGPTELWQSIPRIGPWWPSYVSTIPARGPWRPAARCNQNVEIKMPFWVLYHNCKPTGINSSFFAADNKIVDIRLWLRKSHARSCYCTALTLLKIKRLLRLGQHIKAPRTHFAVRRNRDEAVWILGANNAQAVHRMLRKRERVNARIQHENSKIISL